MKDNITTFSLEQLQALMVSYGQPAFRAKQLYEWIHVHLADSYDDMTNLPKSLRESLAQDYPLNCLSLINRQVSADGSRKYLFELSDGLRIETVGLPEGANETVERLTVCFSTQVGCPMECVFCATGGKGFTRNLTVDEILQQIYFVQTDFDTRVSNLVAMGQGEPFLNYDALLNALRVLNSDSGLNIGARHITISTCGIIESVNRLASEPEQFTLAISLHSAIQTTRDVLMPRVASQPLNSLKAALQAYVRRTNRRVTLEYLLLDGVNDSESDLEALLDFCDGLLCHINLLTLHVPDDSELRPSSPTIFKQWQRVLREYGYETTIRKSRGEDIKGACGQLKNSM